MKKLLPVFLFVLVLSAQYTKDDRELIKTTFLREFDNSIIDSYLNSAVEERVKAGLLSLAQSADSTFIDDIIVLPFHQYGDYIAFALGEIGESKLSSKYLLDKLTSDTGNYRKECFEAIGKTGSINDLNKMIELYHNDELASDGLPYAFYNFFVRDIRNLENKEVDILFNEIERNQNNPDKMFDALFALYRFGPEIRNEKLLTKILSGEVDQKLKVYTLGIFLKQQYFPEDFDLVKMLINSNDWEVRCEAARTVCYYKYSSGDELDPYLNLLLDENPNVSRTAASSVSNIKFSNSQIKDMFLSNAGILLNEWELTENAKGEMVLSLQRMKPEDSKSLIQNYYGAIPDNYYYQLLADYRSDAVFAFQKLSEELAGAGDYKSFFINSAIAALYDSLKNDSAFIKYIFDLYETGTPLIITIYNSTLDEEFISNNREKLSKLIIELFDEHIDDPEYNSALSSSLQIAGKIYDRLEEELLNKIELSENYSLQHTVREKISTGDDYRAYRKELFVEILEYAFEYSEVFVKTNKGNFTIQLLPQFAPVSVGNFLMLASEGFYDGVIFHRVVPNFVIQTGDASGTGWGGPDHTIVSEFSPLSFDLNYVGMASSGKDTEVSQWFVMQNHYPHLDGNYTNFGKVMNGKKVIEMIDQYDRVNSVETKKP